MSEKEGAMFGAIVCDVCGRAIRLTDGFTLTTRQVVTAPKYWEFVLAGIEPVPETAAVRSIEGFLRRYCGDPSGWLVCEECISKFPTVDRAIARGQAMEFWGRGADGSHSPPDGGPVDPSVALDAACTAWKTLTGQEAPKRLLAYKPLASGAVGLPSLGYHENDPERWAPLLRRFLAQRDDAQLDLAIAAARRANEIDVATLLNDFQELERQISSSHRHSAEALIEAFQQGLIVTIDNRLKSLNAGFQKAGLTEEALTVELLFLDMRSRPLAFFEQYLVGWQTRILELGLRSCERATNVAAQLRDQACVAFYQTSKGIALLHSRQSEAARLSLEEALAIRRSLARQNEEKYKLGVAETLDALGRALMDLGQSKQAEEAFLEALAIYRQVSVQFKSNERDFDAHIASTLGNLGNVLQQRCQWRQAKEQYQEALALFLQLADRWPRLHEPYIAGVRSNLVTVLGKLGELGQARDEAEEALQICRRLADRQPEVYEPYLARILGTLANLLHQLKQHEVAAEHAEEALEIFGRLAKKEPQLYDSELARALMNSSGDLEALGQREAAQERCNRSVEIYRRLAKMQPQIYETYLARGLGNLGALLPLSDARKAYSEAASLHERNNAALGVAAVYYNWGLAEGTAGNADRSFELFRDCVKNSEKGIYELRAREDRDLFKRDIEGAYQTLIDYYAFGARSNKAVAHSLVGLLESSRRIDTLAGLAGIFSPGGAGWETAVKEGVDIGSALEVISVPEGCGFLWVHKALVNTVFVSLVSGEYEVSIADEGFFDRFRELFMVVNDEIVRAGRGGIDAVPAQADVSSRIREAAQSVSALLPTTVRDLLFTSDLDVVFISACPRTANFPFEFVTSADRPGSWATRDHTYLGLRRIFSRVVSLRDLNDIVARQPTGDGAVLVGNPSHNGLCSLPGAHHECQVLSGMLQSRKFSLRPDGSCLLNEAADRKRVISALSSDSVQFFGYMGHGGVSRNQDGEATEYLALAGDDRLFPTDVPQLNLTGTMVHLDSCVSGTMRGKGGGRWDGFPAAVMFAGASCVLSTAHPVLDTESQGFGETLCKKLLGDAGRFQAGEALLNTRREMAAAGVSPLIWNTTAFWGNPFARLRDVAYKESE